MYIVETSQKKTGQIHHIYKTNLFINSLCQQVTTQRIFRRALVNHYKRDYSW